MMTPWKHAAPSLVTVPNLVILGQVRAVAKGRPPAEFFSIIFGRLAYFFGGFSASHIFFRRIFGQRFFPANPAEIRQLRPGTTTMGYFYYKDPL